MIVLIIIILLCFFRRFAAMKLSKKFKFAVSFLLVFAVLISSLPIGVFAMQSTGFAGGSGTISDPYLIETKEQLNNVRNDLWSHYKMIANIEFTVDDFSENGDFYNDGECWIPLGDASHTFLGSFDGNGYSVIGIYSNISEIGDAYAGLFGANKGTITNLGVVGGEIGGDSWGFTYAGGIAGFNSGTISNCYSTATIVAKDYGGGIVGINSGKISNCYNAGNINKGQKYGTYAGGIAGVNTKAGEISFCYNVGHITANTSGGIVGDNVGSVLNCYFLESENLGCGSGEGNAQRCTIEEMKSSATYNEFDFDTVWQINSNSSYAFPTLRTVDHLILENIENNSEFLGGNGTIISPYLISEAKHLKNVINYPDAYYKIVNDIIFSEEDNDDWVSIGYPADPFTGNFEGNGYSILGLTKCLFNRNKGTVKNLALSNSTVVDTATIILENYGVLSNCFSSSKILYDSKEKLNVGGLVKINYGTISNCFNQGEISATSTYSTGYVGGIAGTNEGVIDCCYNVGTIFCDKSVGGLVGNNSATISNSYYYELTFNAVGAGQDMGTKATADQLKSKDFFVGFDFDHIWDINVTQSYPAPILRKIYSFPTVSTENNTKQFAGGNGDLFNPYLISNEEQLENVAEYATGKKHFKLINDIVCTKEKNSTVINLFNGVILGGSFSIKNLTFKSTGSNLEIGLIAKNLGIIKNLKIENSSIFLQNATDSVIGVLCANNSGNIYDVQADVNINISNTQHIQKSYIGGIIGNGGGVINNCISIGEINLLCESGISKVNLGGIIGESSADITNVVSKVDISVVKNPELSEIYDFSCGGIVGYSSKSNKENVRNEGNISIFCGSNDSGCRVYVGGIVGTEWQGSTAYGSNLGIIYVEALPVSSSAHIDVGGIIGRTKSGGDVKKSYNVGFISAETKFGNVFVGGIVGATHGNVEDCYNTGKICSKVSNSGFAPSIAGGIVGYGRSGATANKCYNIGFIEADYAGGITGYNDGITHKNAYYINETANGVGEGNSDNTYALIETQLSDSACFYGFDFNLVWQINKDGYPYPTLYNVEHMVARHIVGDANGDARINNRDAAIVMKYINGWKVKVDCDVIDINFDNKVNNKDYIILMRYINGWDIEL